MYSCMRDVFILKKNIHKQKSEKLLQKLVETPFSYLHYKIALKLKLQLKNARALRILLQSHLQSYFFFGCSVWGV
jgi:hypothetical protein